MKQRTVKEGRRLAAEFAASGQSVRAFAEAAGITQWSLHYWVKRARELDGDKKTSGQNGFVELSRNSFPSAAMSIQAGIVQVSFSVLPDASWLSTFVAALNGR